MASSTVEKQAKKYMKSGIVDQAWLDDSGELVLTEMAIDTANEFGLDTSEGAEIWEWTFEMFQYSQSLGL